MVLGHDRSPFPQARVIKVGTLCLEPSELPGPLTLKCKHALGVGGGSTVILVQADRKLLVDTGFDYEHVLRPIVYALLGASQGTEQSSRQTDE